MVAAAMPVISESWAFQASIGSSSRRSRRVPAVGHRHQDLGRREAGAAAFRLEGDACLADLAQHPEQRGIGAAVRVEIGLRRGIVELPAARMRARATVVEVTSPEASSTCSQTNAPRTWSGSSDAAPSLMLVGCNGMRPSAA